jgi:hypothetical protein
LKKIYFNLAFRKYNITLLTNKSNIKNSAQLSLSLAWLSMASAWLSMAEWGGPLIFLCFSSSWVNLRLHTENLEMP